ncbi:hypothetical protein [Mycoplasmopsis cynos]|uniref:hypothetical protein n=1 Tax=Mycoplasmopsis cynos TaxID=171284 RepID=UPI002203757F|nr:hypothetical protein [Mycoplasmopsis cynos]UWV77818.1 hypothetical protein NW070_02925 [Mycoplasmopsis cynos]
MQEYMIKFNRLLTSKNVDSINIEKALLKILSSLKKTLYQYQWRYKNWYIKILIFSKKFKKNIF